MKNQTTERVYNALLRLEQITASTLSYAYSYDNVSNILTKTTGHGNYTYGYDDVYRVTDVDNPVLDDEAYTYDGVGNRLTASDVSGDITHNANNELEIYGDISFAYDANGNMVSKTSASESWAYTYNVQNRLVQVEEDSLLIAEYGYDPFGRRLWKEVDGERIYFLYSDEGLVAEYDESGEEIRSYGYKPDFIWGTDPLWLKEGGEYYWYQNDHVGTPQKLTTQDGTVVWSAQYTAFGEAVIDIETVTNNLRFPGQYYDSETGLLYNFHRYYDPKIGRYLRTDPLDEGVNVYVYCFNNSLYWTDPLGLSIIKDLVDFILSGRRKRQQEERQKQLELELDQRKARKLVNHPVISEQIRRTGQLATEDYNKHPSIPNEYPVQYYQCDVEEVIAQDIPVECNFSEHGGIVCEIKEMPPHYITQHGARCPKCANSHVHPGEDLVFPTEGIPALSIGGDTTSALGRPMIIIGDPRRGQVGVLMPSGRFIRLEPNLQDGGATYTIW